MDYIITILCITLSCLVGVLANTPIGVKRSGLGAHACWVIIYVSKLVKKIVVQECSQLHLVGNSNLLLFVGNMNIYSSSYWCG